MKFLTSILILAFIAITSAIPQPPSMEEKIEKVSNFINNFPGSKDDLMNALQTRMEEKSKDPNHKDWKKEDVEKFVDAVAAKLNGKVITGDEFKKFAAAQLAARGMN